MALASLFNATGSITSSEVHDPNPNTKAAIAAKKQKFFIIISFKIVYIIV
jgi:hypothetical protein